MRNFQRDGHMRMQVPPGRVAYEPNSLDPASPRENPVRGFASFPDPNAGPKLRQRPESFADHYSQARQFWKSMTLPEQGHIVSAFTFELSKVVTVAIRQRMLGHLDLISPELGQRVAQAMGMQGEAEKITPAVKPRDDLPPSPALSLVAKAPATLKGRTVAALVTDGSDGAAVKRLQAALKKEGASLKLVAPRIGKLKGNGLEPDMTVEGGPSVLFDAVVLLPSGRRHEGAAGHGRRRQLGARCLRASQGHRLHPGGTAFARQGGRGTRRQARRDFAGEWARARCLHCRRQEA